MCVQGQRALSHRRFLRHFCAVRKRRAQPLALASKRAKLEPRRLRAPRRALCEVVHPRDVKNRAHACGVTLRRLARAELVAEPMKQRVRSSISISCRSSSSCCCCRIPTHLVAEPDRAECADCARVLRPRRAVRAHVRDALVQRSLRLRAAARLRAHVADQARFELDSLPSAGGFRGGGGFAPRLDRVGRARWRGSCERSVALRSSHVRKLGHCVRGREHDSLSRRIDRKRDRIARRLLRAHAARNARRGARRLRCGGSLSAARSCLLRRPTCRRRRRRLSRRLDLRRAHVGHACNRKGYQQRVSCASSQARELRAPLRGS